MGAINLAAWTLGVILIAVGYSRARGPWGRYQQLREQEANVARYEAWRGGVRDSSESGASVMMALYRRRARLWGAIAVLGFVLVLVGFALS
jgi:hypothetical protein